MVSTVMMRLKKIRLFEALTLYFLQIDQKIQIEQRNARNGVYAACLRVTEWSWWNSDICVGT